MIDTKNTVSDELSEKFGTWLAAHGTPDQIDSYNSYFEREIAPLIRASIPGGVGVKGLVERLRRAGDAGDATTNDFVNLCNEAADALDLSSAEPAPESPTVIIGYTNWRGEYAEREIVPMRPWFGSTDWHPAPQWLLKAWDVAKDAERDFALKDIGFAAPSNPVVSDDAPLVLPLLKEGDLPAWLQMNNLFVQHRLNPPPTKLRDELVTFMEWAWYGEKLHNAALSVKPQSGSQS